jgi:hypothetical protein
MEYRLLPFSWKRKINPEVLKSSVDCYVSNLIRVLSGSGQTFPSYVRQRKCRKEY